MKQRASGVVGRWLVEALKPGEEGNHISVTVGPQQELLDAAAARPLPDVPDSVIFPETGAPLEQTSAGPIVTLGGAPALLADRSTPRFKLEILTTDVVGVATFRFSNDNGDTWTGPLLTDALPVSLGTSGATALFGPGTYTAGTVYTSRPDPAQIAAAHAFYADQRAARLASLDSFFFVARISSLEGVEERKAAANRDDWFPPVIVNGMTFEQGPASKLVRVSAASTGSTRPANGTYFLSGGSDG